MIFQAYDIDTNESFVDDKGYRRVHVGYSHPYHNKGFVYAHRLVMEAHEGRYISPSEIVHHIDENKTNNQITNLFLCSAEEHVMIHNRGRVSSLAARRNIRRGMQDFNRKKTEKLKREAGS